MADTTLTEPIVYGLLRAHPTVLLCDDDRDCISSLNPSETLAAIAEIREALKRSSES